MAMRWIAVNSDLQCVKDREGFKIEDTKKFDSHGILWLVKGFYGGIQAAKLNVLLHNSNPSANLP